MRKHYEAALKLSQTCAYLAFSLVVLPSRLFASPPVEPMKVSYNNATLITGEHNEFKIGLEFRDYATYTDRDQIPDRNAQDTMSFDLRQARIVIGGDLLDKSFSFQVSEEFAGEASEEKDAWLQANLDDGKLRAGQFKHYFSRQELVSELRSEFFERSAASEYFSIKRQPGVMALCDAESGFHYAASIYNGDSASANDRERINTSGIDSDLAGVIAVSKDIGEYGPRNAEGDSFDTQEFAATFGVAVAYGEGSKPDFGHFDQTRANTDIAFRYHGLSAQGEFYFQNFSGSENVRDLQDAGFYLQSGYFFVPKTWEVAARFGSIHFDSSATLDSQFEYGAILGYYLNGHNLKVLLGVSALDNKSAADASDTSDVRYQIGVVAGI